MWITDENNNRCSVEYFGSEEKAREALNSLVNCNNCTNCKECTGCKNCNGCYACYDCTSCVDCICCTECEMCVECSSCDECYSCCNCTCCRTCSYRAEEWDENGIVDQVVVPTIPDIHKAVREACEANCLNMGSWHDCETTHCRAGWVVHLAGDEGYELENKLGTPVAAMLIYKQSGYEISPVRFYDSEEEAMSDIIQLSERN